MGQRARLSRSRNRRSRSPRLCNLDHCGTWHILATDHPTSRPNRESHSGKNRCGDTRCPPGNNLTAPKPSQNPRGCWLLVSAFLNNAIDIRNALAGTKHLQNSSIVTQRYRINPHRCEPFAGHSEWLRTFQISLTLEVLSPQFIRDIRAKKHP